MCKPKIIIIVILFYLPFRVVGEKLRSSAPRQYIFLLDEAGIFICYYFKIENSNMANQPTNTHKKDTTCFTKSLFSKRKRAKSNGVGSVVTALNAMNIAIRRSA